MCAHIVVPVRIVLRQKVDLPGAREFIVHLGKGMSLKVERFEVDEAQFKDGPVVSNVLVCTAHGCCNFDVISIFSEARVWK